jgi:hypothetical protein
MPARPPVGVREAHEQEQSPLDATGDPIAGAHLGTRDPLDEHTHPRTGEGEGRLTRGWPRRIITGRRRCVRANARPRLAGAPLAFAEGAPARARRSVPGSATFRQQRAARLATPLASAAFILEPSRQCIATRRPRPKVPSCPPRRPPARALAPNAAPPSGVRRACGGRSTGASRQCSRASRTDSSRSTRSGG